jgi:hypothetical protein
LPISSTFPRKQTIPFPPLLLSGHIRFKTFIPFPQFEKIVQFDVTLNPGVQSKIPVCATLSSGSELKIGISLRNMSERIERGHNAVNVGNAVLIRELLAVAGRPKKKQNFLKSSRNSAKNLGLESVQRWEIEVTSNADIDIIKF